MTLSFFERGIFEKVRDYPLIKSLAVTNDVSKPMPAMSAVLYCSEKRRTAEAFVDMDFSSVKVRLGRENRKEDLKVVAEVSESIGGHRDVKQGWLREEAISQSRYLQDKVYAD